MIVSKVKTLLDIKDDLQDDAINLIVDNVAKHLLMKIKTKNKTIEVIPEELDFIVEEISIRRYNRLGSEGFQTDSVEGHSITFYELEKDFTPYQEIIDDYKEEDYSSGRGRVRFI